MTIFLLALIGIAIGLSLGLLPFPMSVAPPAALLVFILTVLWVTSVGCKN